MLTLKNKLFLLFVYMSLFLSIFSITTNADEYKIDNEHSFITFKIRHFNAGYVLGRFNIFSGNITFGEKIESSSTNVSINSLSIDTGVAKRDFHLRTAEFLDILKFPEITFKSNKIVAGKDNRHFLITGKLKIKNMEKDITIKAKQLGKSIDPYGQVRVAFKGTTTLNRFDYNINFDGKLKDGNPMIGSKIYTLIFIEAIKVGGVR